MALSDRALEAVVTAGAGAAALLVLRAVLRSVFRRYEARVAARRSPDDVARLRTRLSVLQRAVVAILAAILAWNVLDIFPTTQELADALLASGAVLALLIGLAFAAPLGNLGAGILLAFTQPVRLGDRVTVGEITGEAEEITLIHTILLTDDERRVFIPNSQMIGSVVVNRTIKDPRRSVSVRVPIRLGASVEQARGVVLDAVRGVERPLEDISVRMAEVEERTAWLQLAAFAPRGTDVVALAGELRELSVAALAREKLIPT
jgi:small-conductance mechanosensitive channel